MQLQGAKQRFEAQGLKLASISYDSSAILNDFAKRHRIDFPLEIREARRATSCTGSGKMTCLPETS